MSTNINIYVHVHYIHFLYAHYIFNSNDDNNHYNNYFTALSAFYCSKLM